MSDLSAETRALLERARGADGLPPARRATMRRKLASAVGVAAPLGATASAAASATAWAAKGLAVIGVVGAAHFAVVATAPPAGSLGRAAGEPAFVPIAQPSAPPSPARPVPSVPLAPAPPAPVLAAPIVHPVRAARVPPAPAPAAPIERPDPLTAEVRLLATARRAVDAGDAARALDVLDDHERQFAYGALAPEAAALRVDALCAAGRTGDAEDAARRFVARYPASPLARRFLSTCALHFAPSVTP